MNNVETRYMAGIFLKKWPAFLLLAMATALVWGQTVRFEFVWDDQFFIRELPSIRSLANIPSMFWQLDAQAVHASDFVVFRPIRTALYAILYAIGGSTEPQPWIYHLANVVCHGATAMMLFAVSRLLLRRFGRGMAELDVQLWAFGIALAFAVHPVVSEVVCWAKSLDDILAALFTLAALRELLQPLDCSAAFRRGILFFALAVYSKESAVPFAFIPFVLARTTPGISWKGAVRRTVPFLFVAVLYMVHRHWVIGRTSQTGPISGTYLQTLIDMFPVVLTYVRLLFGIPPFCIDYTYLPGGCRILSEGVIGGMAVLVLLVVAGLCAWRSEKWRLMGFGLLWVGLFLLPVSNVIPMMQYMAERFLYLPLIGWVIAIVTVLVTVQQRTLIQIVGLCVALCWAVTAWNRSWVWSDEVTLYTRTSQECPKCDRVENNGVAAIIHLPHIRDAFKLEDGKLSVIGAIDPASLDNVLKTFTAALAVFPGDHTLLSALGVTLASTGHPDKAVPYFERAATSQPNDVEGLLNLARATFQLNQSSAVRAALDKVFVIDPDNHFALAMLFECQWNDHDYTAARQTALRWNHVAPDENSAAALARVESEAVKGQ